VTPATENTLLPSEKVIEISKNGSPGRRLGDQPIDRLKLITITTAEKILPHWFWFCS